MIKKAIAIASSLLIASLVIYYFLPESRLPPNITIDKLVVLKSKRQLLAYSKRQLIKTYKISLGFSPLGKKAFDGDGKTPEGHYSINDKNPNSVCHKNLGISYPGKQDVLNAKKAGLPAGGAIKIHGLSNGKGFIGKFHRWYDWTDGCIAVTNDEIDDLYNHTPIGTPIEIKP
jgi:murein L,D-transpeptidase YafK